MEHKKWFVSDLHFFHNNILKFTKRPYEDVISMHEGIVEEWNKVVAREDVVYHLGDLSFKNKGDQLPLYDILNQLNGSLVCLKGNHHHSNLWSAHRKAQENGVLRKGIKFVDSPYMETKWKKRKLILSHYPIVCWNGQHHNTLHIHGHTHNNLDVDLGKAMDVGYDALWENHHLKHPIEFDHMIEILDKKESVFYDHHGDLRLRGNKSES